MVNIFFLCVRFNFAIWISSMAKVFSCLLSIFHACHSIARPPAISVACDYWWPWSLAEMVLLPFSTIISLPCCTVWKSLGITNPHWVGAMLPYEGGVAEGLFGILPCERFVYYPPFISLFNHLFILVMAYGYLVCGLCYRTTHSSLFYCSQCSHFGHLEVFHLMAVPLPHFPVWGWGRLLCCVVFQLLPLSWCFQAL